MSFKKTAVFIDGENLVFRFQEMLKQGMTPKKGLTHLPDEFVWHGDIFSKSRIVFTRATLYTSAVGDDDHIHEVAKRIKAHAVLCPYDGEAKRFTLPLTAKVFKKPAKSQKSRLVDIHITLDAIRASHIEDLDQIILMTGDGDFLPVVEDIMRMGKRVVVCSLSHGLNEKLKVIPDEHWSIDGEFFA